MKYQLNKVTRSTTSHQIKPASPKILYTWAKKWIGIFRNGLILAFAFLLLINGSIPSASAVQASSTTGPQMNQEDIETFMDVLMSEQFAERPVAGAAVVVVKDGEILFAKGYGEADVPRSIPVQAEKTLFRLGSVTKLFTWTAVMQMVEQGKLDLDADIKTYLDFTIPATYPEPVTMRHLMSHSAGFEDQLLGIFVAGPEQILPASQWLPKHLPSRVRPPGTASSYSNYGTALAGYIVERVSGMSYEAFIEENILRPLQMNHTSLRQPLPGALAENLSGGYHFKDGRFNAGTFEFTQTAPAGAMSASATDMAAFMIAHLQHGEYGGQRILAEETAKLMHSPLFQHDPRINGFAYGFYRTQRNGQVVLSHSGDTTYFHSQLILLPDSNVGLFAVYNTTNTSRLRASLVEAFLNRYFPAPIIPIAANPEFAQRPAHFAGVYRSIQHAYTTPDKIIMLTSPSWTMRAEGDLLVLRNPRNKEEQRFVEVEPLLFQQLDGQERLAFRENKQGQVELAFIESDASFALEKVAWYEAVPFHLGLLGTVLLLFLSVIGVEIVRTGVRFTRRKTVPAQPLLQRTAHWTVITIAGLSLLFLIATAMITTRMMASLGADQPPQLTLKLLASIPQLLMVLTTVSVVLLVPIWRKPAWNINRKIYHTLLVFASSAFLWFLTYWNLL